VRTEAARRRAGSLVGGALFLLAVVLCASQAFSSAPQTANVRFEMISLEQGLSPKRHKQLIEQLDLWPQTLARWRQWWQQTFVVSRCWQAARGHFIHPVAVGQLPGALLGRLSGVDLRHRLCLLLRLLAPVTTTSWSGSLRVAIDPQKM